MDAHIGAVTSIRWSADGQAILTGIVIVTPTNIIVSSMLHHPLEQFRSWHIKRQWKHLSNTLNTLSFINHML